MKSILFIHQSAELYGSDKTILMFISSLDKQQYKSVVILPFDGPLKREFEKNGIEVERFAGIQSEMTYINSLNEHIK
jgi:hypothetical protein